MSLLKECGLVAGNTHLNYEGYKLFLCLMTEHGIRKTIVAILQGRFASLSSDGSDDFGHKSQEGIYLRIVSEEGKPRNLFIGLEELNYQVA